MGFQNIYKKTENIEFIFLCILLFVLPILESPKTIAAVFFGTIWIMRRFISKNTTSNEISLIEISLALILISSLISTLINIPFKNQFKGFKDTFLWCSIFWFIYKNNYSKKHQYIAAICITSGVLAGIMLGIYEAYKGIRPYLEFHSAGVVTQSSIYLGIALMIPFSIFVTKTQVFSQSPIKSKNNFSWLLLFAVMTTTLIFMASRGAILAVAVTLLASIILSKKKILFFVVGIVLSTAFIIAVYLPDSFQQKRFYQKSIDMASSQKLDPSDSIRVFNWKIAIAKFKLGDSVLFGIGPRNFSSIKLENLNLNEHKKIPLTHAHNLFLNKLVEEGIFGLLSFVFFLSIILIELIRTRSLCRYEWIWFSALGSLSVPIIAGSFNTPWYQEHALLAMIILGMFMSNKFSKTIK